MSEGAKGLSTIETVKREEKGKKITSVNISFASKPSLASAEAVPFTMGMPVVETPLVPLSLSLPPLRKSTSLTEAQARQSLRRLHEFTLYPIPPVLELESSSHNQDASALDSGYASETEADEASKAGKAIPLYLDPIERDFAVRWLTAFIGQAWEFPLNDDIRDEFVDAACSLLSYFTSPEDDSNTPDEDPGMTRRFQFSTGKGAETFVVDLYDTPMQTGEDHTDVGLQTWGASIAFSQMFCTAPMDFLATTRALDSSTRIVELGAGTGLVSLVLASLLPTITDSVPSIVATDYHPTVLKNLEKNAASHYKEGSTAMVQVAHLDWCAPPLDVPADILVAADVVYAVEHARWLRNCAASLLTPDGVFWLMVSIRPNGKFAGVCDSIESIFTKPSLSDMNGSRYLEILDNRWIDKKDSVGRADEVGYKLFRIGWA